MTKKLTNKSWLIGFLGFLGLLGLKGEPNIILSFMLIDYGMLYRGALIIFSLTFAIGVNSWSYLTYKYDKED